MQLKRELSMWASLNSGKKLLDTQLQLCYNRTEVINI